MSSLSQILLLTMQTKSRSWPLWWWVCWRWHMAESLLSQIRARCMKTQRVAFQVWSRYSTADFIFTGSVQHGKSWWYSFQLHPPQQGTKPTYNSVGHCVSSIILSAHNMWLHSTPQKKKKKEFYALPLALLWYMWGLCICCVPLLRCCSHIILADTDVTASFTMALLF